MALIGPFNAFVNGNVTDADKVMENLYHPNAAPDSIEGMNGWLDKTNAATAPNDWTVKRVQIRPQSMSRAKMVGLTGHSDHLDTFDQNENIYVPVPGAAISFYLPRAAKVLLLTWQIVGAGDDAYGPAIDPQIPFRFFMDGVYQPASLRYVAASRYSVGAEDFRLADRDRVYSGHASFMGTTEVGAGWHSAHIAVYKSLQAVQARLRVRNMKYIAFF